MKLVAAGCEQNARNLTADQRNGLRVAKEHLDRPNIQDAVVLGAHNADLRPVRRIRRMLKFRRGDLGSKQNRQDRGEERSHGVRKVLCWLTPHAQARGPADGYHDAARSEKHRSRNHRR